MNIIIDFWNKIPIDKKLHFSVGINIALAFGLKFGAFYGLLFATMAGIAKEALDMYFNGKYDYRDFIFTFAGGIFGLIILGLMG